MLRMVLNVKRQTVTPDPESQEQSMLEPWPDFLKRTAETIDDQLEKAGLLLWTTRRQRRKWKWAHHLLTDDRNKWSNVATIWQPLLHSSCPRARKQARPKKRWETEVEEFLKEKFLDEGRQWKDLLKDTNWWTKSSEAFEKYGN